MDIYSICFGFNIGILVAAVGHFWIVIRPTLKRGQK